MAKEWKALWEDLDDETGAEKKTKKSSSAADSDKKWYYSDGRDNEDDEKDRTILGFDTRYTEDDRAGTDYGGYGYGGSSGYGYYDGFDDSDTDWYRRGSWRYSRQADYSPSSQFRSTFSRYTYTGSGTDDAKNKAIRALRNLTRSANTIVDKTVGSKQKSFTVQFSNGSDSNGVSAALNEEQQRVVYVSPDELLATSTTEDEDSVIDALTGFVLLRVQIAQDVKADVIRRINATGLHTAAFRAAENLFTNKDSIDGIDAGKFSRETVDDYLAGILAKSMLTRLARRGVVSSWGGFAPYFIRHAKKFALVRENLEKAEKSIETVVGIIGYNMLADESQIELPKDINDVVSKHLGTEVEHGVLLDKCRELVAELREFMAKAAEAAGEAVPAGAIESALSEMMADAQKQQSKHSDSNKELNDLLSQVAGAMGAASDTADTVESARAESAAEELKMCDALKKATSMDQLLKNLEKLIKDLDAAKKLHEEARSADAANMAYTAKNQASYNWSSRPSGAEALDASGIKEVSELKKMLDRYETFNGADGKEKIEKLKELLEKVCEKGSELLKKQRSELKTKAAEQLEHMYKMLEAAQSAGADTTKKIGEASDRLHEKPFSEHGEQPQALATLNSLQAMVDSFKEQVNTAHAKMPEHMKDLAGARSLTTIKKSFEEGRRLAQNALGSAGRCFYDNYALHCGPMMTRLTTEMARALGEMPDGKKDAAKAAEQAVAATMAAGSMSDIGFMSALVDGFMREMLSGAIGDDSGERKAKADELGISVETLNKLIAALRNALSSGKSSETAKKLGAETADKIAAAQTDFSPVDRHLFGDKIEAKTTVLTGDSISHVNDEARNAAEEEYVAYLDHNNCKPKVVTQQEAMRHGGAGYGQTVVQQVKTKNKSAIERIRNALQFQSGKRTVETHGLRSGDLDEGSLHKLSYDCEHIWSQKTMSKLPDVAVGILVDQSGSMSGGKIDQARELCITMAEAIRRITGVRLYVYGHTANMGGADLTIYEHYTPAMGADMTRLGGITAHCNNYDGYAIKDVAKRLSEDPAKRKYLFVIADGLPAGAGYGGETAAKHVTSVCKFTRDRLKIGTYAFAVGVSGHYQQMFKRQYGENHVVFVDRVMKCLPQIVRFLRNALQQERKLVAVED